MAFLPLALTVASTAISGYSQFQQSMYQSAVAKNNAKIAEKNADRASYAAQINQMRSDREYAQQESAQLAAGSASGLDVLGRSQVLARSTLAAVRGEEAKDIRDKGLFDVRNFQQEQANYLGEARAAKTQAWMGLVSTAFDIGGAVASSPQGKKLAHSLIGGTK
jgi:multidrug resistance efflux pump